MVPQIAQTRPDAAAAQAAASPDQVASETYRSPQFRKGEEQGRLHAELICNWARLLPPVAPGREPIFPRALGEELDGIAEGAGVSAAAVRAAVADPAALLGEWDVVVSEQAGSVGLVVACGRQLAPQVQSRGADAGQATLVGLPGLNAAVLGWNTSGLVAWIGDRGRSAAGDLRAANPAAVAVAAVAESARTFSEALDLLQGMAPLDGSINLMMLSTGSMQTIGINGDLHPLTTNTGSQPQGSLSRVLLESGQRSVSAGLERLLDPTTGEADRLSTAVNWLAVGRTGGLPVVRGGGPLTQWFDPQAVTIPRLASSATAENDVQSAGSSDPGITRRYLLGCSPLSPAVAESRLDGQRVLVLGQGPLAAAVATAIRASGGDVSVATGGSHQAAEAAVDHAEAAGPVQHLILAAELSPDSVANRADAVVTAPFFACQRWIAARQRAGGLAGASLTALTRLGGDFGAGGRIVDAAGGGLAGLLKNIAHEFPELQVRIVDHGAEASEAVIAAAAVAEICHPAGPVEVGYGADGRQQPLMVEEALPATEEGLAATAAGNVWLVTGGARGVTAACGLALGQRYGLRLALVGSTEPLPIEAAWLDLDQAGLQTLKGRLMIEAKSRGEDPRQAWRAVEKSLEIARSLAACRAAGVDARYFSCDLADAAAVERLVSEVERSIGPISGLLHGAGFEAACRFEKKTAAGLAATVGPKAIGLERLVAAIDSKSLRAVIGFGSTSGRFGGHGQADYSLANDLLAKIVAKLRRDRDISATVFHWHAWDEVGMASRPESRFVLEQFGLQFMPLAEGVGHFLREVAAGLPAAEVIVTEPAFCEAAGPVQQAAAPALSSLPMAQAVAGENRGSLVATVETSGGGTQVGFSLDPTSDCFLREHTQYGRPLLPAVMAAELLAQAVRTAGVVPAVEELRDVRVERPVNFPADAARTVEVAVGSIEDGAVSAVGWAPVLNAAGKPPGESRPHISGRIVVGQAEPIRQQLDEQLFPFNPMVYQEDAPLHHGRTFRTLSGLFLDRSGGWARLTAPDPNVVAAPRGAAGWTVPIALLDGCVVACAVYSYILLGKRVEVPLRFERLRIVGQPSVGEACTLRLFYRMHDEHESRYDFTLYAADSRPLLAVDGLHLAVVPSRETS